MNRPSLYVKGTGSRRKSAARTGPELDRGLKPLWAFKVSKCSLRFPDHPALLLPSARPIHFPPALPPIIQIMFSVIERHRLWPDELFQTHCTGSRVRVVQTLQCSTAGVL
jgi:hypothetical protein